MYLNMQNIKLLGLFKVIYKEFIVMYRLAWFLFYGAIALILYILFEIMLFDCSVLF